jgi:hypothetical protein
MESLVMQCLDLAMDTGTSKALALMIGATPTTISPSNVEPMEIFQFQEITLEKDSIESQSGDLPMAHGTSRDMDLMIGLPPQEICPFNVDQMVIFQSPLITLVNTDFEWPCGDPLMEIGTSRELISILGVTAVEIFRSSVVLVEIFPFLQIFLERDTADLLCGDLPMVFGT